MLRKQNIREDAVLSANFSLELVLRESSLFSDIRPATFERLATECHLVFHPRGHVLFMQDDAADWAYFVLSGWVKLFRETLEGEEVVLDIVSTGAILGENTFFTSGHYTFGGEIVDDSRVLAIPIELFQHEISAHPPFAMAMMRHMAKTQTRRERDIEHRTLQNAPQRIGCFLLRHCNRDAKGPIRLHLPFDKSLVAAYLGMQPETFSRAMARLQADVGLSIVGSSVDIPRTSDLVTYVCATCSTAFPCDDI